MITSAADDAVGAAAALAGLPLMGPRRLTALLEAWDPEEAWARATSGDLARLRVPSAPEILAGDRREASEVARLWRSLGAACRPAEVLADHRAAGVQVLLRHDPAYPEVLRADHDAPVVLFVQGDLASMGAQRVAIVGTRRCTGIGAGFARELGRELTATGVSVVSGLALGIDGAAHRGVLDALPGRAGAAPPVGVVGSGLDVVYPARHRDLWDAVRTAGALLSEAPLGARPAAWRFPARNRIIAALADVVVVVESHVAGGSLHTVSEAAHRGIPVMAVPGSVRSPAAAGTNQLLADGCHPVRDVDDVLVALGLTAASSRTPAERRPAPDAEGDAVLAAFDWEPATLEHLAVRTGIGLAALAVAVERLVATGWVSVQGGWYERVAPA